MLSSAEYNEKLKDPRWQRKRLKIFERDKWTCQLCTNTKLELHVHHLHRTTEEPWEEPDLHLLTLCKPCHEQQKSNPHGGFKPPKRLYKTDAEWWTAHCHEFDEDTQEKLDERTVHGFDIREVMKKLRIISEGIHELRLEWDLNQSRLEKSPKLE